jgi:hypothetical protein
MAAASFWVPAGTKGIQKIKRTAGNSFKKIKLKRNTFGI